MRNHPIKTALGAVLLILAGGYTGYWYWGADRMDATIAGWLQEWQGHGYGISYTDKTVSGFPGPIRVTLTEPRMADPSGAWTWSAAALTLAAAPWSPTRYTLDAGGLHQADVPIAGRLVGMRVDAQTATGTAVFDLAGRLERADVVLENVAGSAPDLNAEMAAGRMTVVLTQNTNRVRSHEDQQAELELVLQDVALPEAYSGPLGPGLDHLSTRARLMGPMPRTDLRSALENWRDAGGILDVPWLQVDWGPLRLRGEGTMTVDGTLRPVAAFQTRVAGFAETLDALAGARLIAEQAARVAGLALSLLAETPRNGGPPELTVPVSVQEGDFYLGPVRLGSVPPVLPPVAQTQPAPPPAAVRSEALPAPQ